MFKRLNKLKRTPLLRQVRGLLQLVVLLLKSIVELWEFDLHIVLYVLLLVTDDLKDFVFEFLFTLYLQLFELVKHGVHERSEDAHVLGGHLFSLLDVIFNVSKVLLEVVQPLKRTSDLLFFTLELAQWPMTQPKHFYVVHRLLCVGHFRLLVGELLLDALLAQWLFLKHHDRLREVLLTEVHLHCVCKKGHLLSKIARSFFFFKRDCR